MSLKEKKALRKELHKHPELSSQEAHTSTRIKNFIKRHHNTHFVEQIGGHGLAAVYTYGEDDPVIVIRCELDSLPIEESLPVPYKSLNPGVSHKCGHDGHMAIVAGLVFWLKTQTFKKGKIILLFQPAEETGEGATAVLNDQRFSDLKPDFIFSLHNVPGFPLNSIVMTDKQFCAAVQSVVISLEGEEAHSAQPENGKNPALCMAELIRELDRLNHPDLSREDFTLLVPVYSTMGKKSYGISAGFGELHYTLRTWSFEKMQSVQMEVEGTVSRISKKRQIISSLKWIDYFPPVVNDDHCNRVIARAAKKIPAGVIEKPNPFRFGEDFDWFSQKYKSAMYGIGAGVESAGLHQPDYDQMFRGDRKCGRFNC